MYRIEHMIIGHLPAGYVISKILSPCFEDRKAISKFFVLAGVLGALAPDLDMLYFHLIDHRQHHHHTYLTHYPIVWFSLFLISISWLCSVRSKGGAMLAVFFSLNGIAHLFLDTIVGDIWWLAPFNDSPFVFFTVPALYKPWWLNFVLHWSFCFEIAVIAWAFTIFRRIPNVSLQGAL